MKTVIFLMFWMIISFDNYAQPYQSLFGQQNTYWIQKWENLPGAVRDSFYVEKDTMYNGLEYKKIRAGSHEYSGALMREDTLTGKVWYQPLFDPDDPPYWSKDTMEKLAFDFNLDVGDTFDLHGCIFSDDSVVIVDSVYFMNGRKHIRFDLKTYYVDEQFEMIEGVGSNFGINYKHFCSLQMSPYLICAYKDNMVAYRNRRYDGDCDVRFGDVMVPEAESMSSLHVYPNPARETLHFLFPSGGATIKLTDISGRITDVQVIKNDVKALFDVQRYTPGIYLYQVITQDGVHSGRVLICR